MTSMKKIKLFMALPISLLISCLVLPGCSSLLHDKAASANSLQILTIGTADSGGTMSAAGKSLAKVIEGTDSSLKVNVAVGSGSAENVRNLSEGDIDLGLVSGDVAFAAVNGTGEFSEEPVGSLRTLAAVYPSLSNWMALSSSRLFYVHDLGGKRIGMGPQDSTTEMSARTVLTLMGITPENSSFINCGLGSGADNVKTGSLDAIHGFTGIPIESFAHVAGETSVRLLKYTDQELLDILRTNSFYYQDVIPAGTYPGQTSDVSTFGIKCLLCVRSDMDEELTYELTAILCEQAETLAGLNGTLSYMTQRDFMYSELPIELHDGAKRYYEGHGLLPINQ